MKENLNYQDSRNTGRARPTAKSEESAPVQKVERAGQLSHGREKLLTKVVERTFVPIPEGHSISHAELSKNLILIPAFEDLKHTVTSFEVTYNRLNNVAHELNQIKNIQEERPLDVSEEKKLAEFIKEYEMLIPVLETKRRALVHPEIEAVKMLQDTRSYQSILENSDTSGRKKLRVLDILKKLDIKAKVLQDKIDEVVKPDSELHNLLLAKVATENSNIEDYLSQSDSILQDESAWPVPPNPFA